MTLATKKTTRFRELVERPQIAVAVGGVLPIHAIMVERAGYDFFFMGGTMLNAWMSGWADVGVATMTEIIDQAARIAKVTELPLFCDADTGGGSAVSVWRTTQEFIHAGVAGIHLEDQADPKLSGDRAGKRLLPLDEALGKFRAAIDAKEELDPDFIVCARTDARTATGGSLEEAIRRGRAFADAGVDLVFYAELLSWEECVYALKETPIPAFCIIDPVGGPLPSLQEQQKAGHALAIYPRVITNAQNQAGWEALMDFKERGQVAIDDFDAGAKSRKWRFELEKFLKVNFKRVREMEGAYYPPQLQRDYGERDVS
jgi:2-methylisocitrate lyase-like PEP mutase family enzyme